MNLDLTSQEKKLLNLIQWEFPLCERPFAELGAKVGISEAQAISITQKLKEERIVRQISAIFDTRSLGYRSMLVAMNVEPERDGEAAAIINEHPGVSHNYRRNHELNIWFTVAVAPNSRIGLEKTVEILHTLARARSTRMLPTLKLYKIGVKLDVEGKHAPDDTEAEGYNFRKIKQEALTQDDVELVRALQEDCPLVESPFEPAARRLGIGVPELVERARQFTERGKMRRFAAVLNHRRAGFTANGMGVWQVEGDDARIDEVGLTMGSFRAVSHCYRRPIYADWPYSIFTMVHGRSTEECEQILKAIQEKTGVQEYRTLYSTREYKKIRLRYFTQDMEAWESKAAGMATIPLDQSACKPCHGPS